MTILSMLKDMAIYPFRGSGPVMLVIGTFVMLLFAVTDYAPLIGSVAGLLGSMYLGAFYLQVIGQTVSGNDEIPDWPSLTDMWSDIILPNVRITVAMIFGAVPMIGTIVAYNGEVDFHSPLIWTSIIFAALYIPMALLNIAVYETMVSALPHRVLPAIFRSLPSYLISPGLFILMIGVEIVSSIFAERVPYVSWVVLSFISFYFMVIQGRIIGLIYRRSEEAIQV